MTKPEAERLDWHTLFKLKDDADPAFVSALDSYFECFAQPKMKIGEDGRGDIGDQPCIKCEKPLLCLMSMVLGGGFTWGIVHGEGFCRECKWPARAHHFIKDAEGKDVITIRNVILQYHPDFVSERKRKSAAA